MNKKPSSFSTPFLALLYHENPVLSRSFHKVAGSSPKGRGKGAMVKGGCFLPLKTRKAFEIQGSVRLIHSPSGVPRGTSRSDRGSGRAVWGRERRRHRPLYPGSNQATRFASLNRKFAGRLDAVLLQAEPQSSHLCLALRAHRRLSGSEHRRGKRVKNKSTAIAVLLFLAPPAGLEPATT